MVQIKKLLPLLAHAEECYYAEEWVTIGKTFFCKPSAEVLKTFEPKPTESFLISNYPANTNCKLGKKEKVKVGGKYEYQKGLVPFKYVGGEEKEVQLFECTVGTAGDNLACDKADGEKIKCKAFVDGKEEEKEFSGKKDEEESKKWEEKIKGGEKKLGFIVYTIKEGTLACVVMESEKEGKKEEIYLCNVRGKEAVKVDDLKKHDLGELADLINFTPYMLPKKTACNQVDDEKFCEWVGKENQSIATELSKFDKKLTLAERKEFVGKSAELNGKVNATICVYKGDPSCFSDQLSGTFLALETERKCLDKIGKEDDFDTPESNKAYGEAWEKCQKEEKTDKEDIQKIVEDLQIKVLLEYDKAPIEGVKPTFDWSQAVEDAKGGKASVPEIPQPAADALDGEKPVKKDDAKAKESSSFYLFSSLMAFIA